MPAISDFFYVNFFSLSSAVIIRKGWFYLCRKRIRSDIQQQSPLFTTEILSDILPQKSDVQQAKITLHNGDQAIVILAGKQPVFFLYDRIYFPSGKL